MSDETPQAQSAPSDPTVNLDAPAAPAQEKEPEGQQPEGEQQQPKGAEPQAPEGQREGDDGEGDDGERPGRKSGYQRLKSKAERLERENAELRARGGAAATDDAGIKSEVEKRIGAPPKQEDFADVFAYEREATAYSAARRVAEVQVRQEAESAKARHEQARREAFDDHLDRVNAIRRELKDFDDVVAKAGNVEAKPHIEELIISSDDSGRLLYHLLKDPALVNELNALSPVAAARRMGQIEAGLQRPAQTRTTKAPAPLAAAKGGAAPAPDPTKGPDDMAEYVRWRQSQRKG